MISIRSIIAGLSLPTIDLELHSKVADGSIAQLHQICASRRVGIASGCDARISELLALRIEKHISDDRSTLFIRQQRGKKGGVKTTLKSDAAFRDIDLHSALAKMLSDYIGDRKEGFLLQTRSGNMLSPESFFRSGFA